MFLCFGCILGERVAHEWVFEVHARALYGRWVAWVLCHPYMMHFIQMGGVFCGISVFNDGASLALVAMWWCLPP